MYDVKFSSVSTNGHPKVKKKIKQTKLILWDGFKNNGAWILFSGTAGYCKWYQLMLNDTNLAATVIASPEAIVFDFKFAKKLNKIKTKTTTTKDKKRKKIYSQNSVPPASPRRQCYVTIFSSSLAVFGVQQYFAIFWLIFLRSWQKLIILLCLLFIHVKILMRETRRGVTRWMVKNSQLKGSIKAPNVVVDQLPWRNNFSLLFLRQTFMNGIRFRPGLDCV